MKVRGENPLGVLTYQTFNLQQPFPGYRPGNQNFGTLKSNKLPKKTQLVQFQSLNPGLPAFKACTLCSISQCILVLMNSFISSLY